MTRRRVAAGVLAVGAYLGVAFASTATGPILPLYDGQAPPEPYRWVNPPDDAQTDQPALGGRQELLLQEDVPIPLNATTDDGQAVLTGTEENFALVEGQEAVVVTIEPLDPATLGEPPGDLVFDGNAYRFEARFRPSGEPAELTEAATVVLRYAKHGTDILELEGGRWVPLKETTDAPAVLQLFGKTPDLGTFVAAGPAPPFNATPFIAGGLAALAIGALVVARTRMSRATGSQRNKRKPGAKPRQGKRPRR